MKKKSFILWADDDWRFLSKKAISTHMVETTLKVIGVFHYTKHGCYEGKPRRVRITIEELP